MKALLADELPPAEDWRYEVKFDGIRAIAVKEGREVRLYSRRPREITADYPDLVWALRGLSVREAVLDGEIVALDEAGRSSFQLLQNRNREDGEGAPEFYILFDAVRVGARDLTGDSLEERRKQLKRILPRDKPPLRISAWLEGAPSRIWAEVVRLGLEGVIAKKKGSQYESDRRSGAWRKIKAQNQQEFVIGGYSEPQGARRHFGAILVGYYDRGRLRFASAVGTGFDEATLRSLHRRFQGYRRVKCPFVDFPPAGGGGRWGKWTPREIEGCTWLRPALVCEVRFQEWTRDGNLRQPVYLGLRTDKKPLEVKRERGGAAAV